MPGIAAPTQLASINSSAGVQTSWSTGAIVFPTTGQNVLGILEFQVSGYTPPVNLTVTDNLGNTWSVLSASQTLGAANQTTIIAYFNYPSAGGSTTATVTVAFASSSLRLGSCGYTTGHDPVTPLDLSDTDTENTGGTSSPLATAGNLAVDGELVIVSWGAVGTAAPSSWPTTGFTSIYNIHDATRNRSGSAEYQVLGAGTAGSPASATVAYTPAGASASVLATFRPAGAAPPSNTAVPTVSGTVAVGSTLTTTDGTWTGTPTSYAYQWQRGDGTTMTDIPGATANTYAIPGDPNPADDVGSKLRCKVTASNANGAGTPAVSASTTVVAAPASQISYRVVGKAAMTDEQVHAVALSKPVLADDLLVLFVGCSNSKLVDGNGNKADQGYVFDANGNTWTQVCEAFHDTDATLNQPQTLDANIIHSGQAFTTHSPASMAVGATVTLNNHTIGTTPINVVGDDPLAYHGSSPYFYIVAVSTGDSRILSFDAAAHNVDLLTTHAAPSITMAHSTGIVLGFHCGSVQAAAGWWTPATGFVEVADEPQGTESNYNVSGEAKTTSAGYTGGAGGATGSNKNLTNLVVAFSSPTPGGTVSFAANVDANLMEPGTFDTVFNELGVWQTSGAAATTLDATVSHSGTKSLKVVTDGTVANDGVFRLSGRVDPVAAITGATYTLDLWLRSVSGGENLTIKTTQLDSSFSFVTSQNSTVVLNAGWNHYVLPMGLAISGLKYLQVEVVTTGTAAYTWWVDDVYLIPGAVATAEAGAIKPLAAAVAGVGTVAAENFRVKLFDTAPAGVASIAALEIPLKGFSASPLGAGTVAAAVTSSGSFLAAPVGHASAAAVMTRTLSFATPLQGVSTVRASFRTGLQFFIPQFTPDVIVLTPAHTEEH